MKEDEEAEDQSRNVSKVSTVMIGELARNPTSLETPLSSFVRERGPGDVVSKLARLIRSTVVRIPPKSYVEIPAIARSGMEATRRICHILSGRI